MEQVRKTSCQEVERMWNNFNWEVDFSTEINLNLEFTSTWERDYNREIDSKWALKCTWEREDN